ncbi:MAG: tRNA-uridine aminocarboxypropyltransferase [Pseudomonadota bacterium]
MKTDSSCSKCWKELESCICAQIEPIQNSIEVLILQHPQEARSSLTTSRLLALGLKNCTHRVGFSWGSLKAALKKEVKAERWVVLFVGTQKSAEKVVKDKLFEVVDKKGNPAPKEEIQGIVVLDGNWKQSKTLWWRNPWLLKLKRIVLNPSAPSLYGNLRKEPRAGLLSTIEATALALDVLGEKSSAKAHLEKIFEEQVKAWKKLR